jgi:CheY-like chemotaxis protein
MDLPERSPSHQRSSKSTILIADDDSAIVSLLADLLRQHEFHVVTACDGAQALDRARDHAAQIDLLLTDFEMPHMNGVQLAVAIRQFHPRIGVVLMSGSHHLEAASQARSTFLSKPFTPGLLLETITGLLGDA